MSIKASFALPLLLVGLFTGCNHVQLRYNQVQQAKTVTGLLERQVLDNLAMFVGNPEALPFMSIPDGGVSRVTDNGGISAGPLNGPAHTVLSLTAFSRSNYGSWTYDPVTDTKRLTRMRCAYRRAIGIMDPNDGCVDCCALEQAWQGKDSDDMSVCFDCCAIQPIRFEVCGKKLLRDPCEKVGSYCGTYIRVCPESYGDFTRLVLKIMEYASNDPAKKSTVPQMDVEHFHYKKVKGEFITDSSGRFIIEQIDRFQAPAHEYIGPDGKTVKPSGPVELVGVTTKLTPDLFPELYRQEKINALYPAD